jgi:hypothetical protein
MFNQGEFKFHVNQVVITKAAADVISGTQVYCGLQLHQMGEWGDICEEDRLANEEALLHGGRLMSVYKIDPETVFWIITEWDLSVTTVLLPEDY